ncbi:hypothetical protein [Anabaena sp. 54]|uniref:hypothetical protein n=1 Tax=Anabaena sp. 54 TaxID=46231 RepID=UPI0025C2EE68|nr:hypothetical protein [Anabaena sp. 54]MBO1067838.1 hypothetical protein [Anabaena sp. 54]
MLHTTFIISYFDPVQITITISYVFSILYHINVYRILLLMPASSVAIALAFRKNRSLGKTFWFTDYNHLRIKILYLVVLLTIYLL